MTDRTRVDALALWALIGVTAAASTASAGDVAPARARVIYTLPATPALDVYIGTEPGAGPPTFSGVSFADPTEYEPLPPGAYTIFATPADDPRSLVLLTGAEFGPASTSSFLVVGFYPVLQGLPVAEDPAVSPAAARVRFLHASQGEGNLDALLDGGPVLATGVEFSEAGAAVDVVPGKYDVEVRDSETGVDVLVMLGEVFDAGRLYTVLVAGTSTDGTMVGDMLLDNEVEPDVNGDGAVDVLDIVDVITSWGACVAGPGQCPADATDDAAVGVDDLEAVLLNFGR